MKAKANKKKKNRVTLSNISWICLAAQTVLSMTFKFHPVTQVLIVLLCVPMLISLWRPQEKSTVLSKIITTFSLLVYTLPSLIFPYRAVILIDILLVAALTVGLIYINIAKKCAGNFWILWMIESVCATCRLCFRAFNYSFISNALFPLWQIPLALGIVLGIFVTVKWVWDKNHFWRCVGSLVACCLFATLIFWVFAVHLNYTLDFSPPQHCTAMIEKKDIDHHRKGPDDYEFEFTVNGHHLVLEVPSAEYYAYEVGDTYNLDLYQGAFGAPFYLAGIYSES